MSEPTWIAVIVDRDGFVMAPEQIELWCTSEGGREYAHQYGDSEPDELMVVTGEAKPEPQSDAPDERFFRRPNPLLLNDVMLREDIYRDRPEKVLRLWERAQATAAAMNTAEVQ